MVRHAWSSLVVLALAALACKAGEGNDDEIGEGTGETGDGDGDGDGDVDSTDGDGESTDDESDDDTTDGTDTDEPDEPLSCDPIACGPSNGVTIELGLADDLQVALDAAQAGDTLVLPAGATFTGNFVVAAREGAGCLTIRTSTTDDELQPGVRVGPDDAGLLARVISPGNGLPALRVAPGAHDVRLVGLELAPESAQSEVYEVLALGTGGPDQVTLDQAPTRILVERSWIHAWPDVNFKRGIGLNSADTCIADSTIADFHSDFQDAQAIGGFNGPGPYRILNNRLEGSTENILFGGATPSIPDLVPSDIEILGNHFYKPLAWKAEDPANTGYVPWVKNLFEIKNGRNVVLAGNLLENNWVGADQHGVAIVLTPRGEDGTAPWATVENVTIRDNVIRHVGGAVAVLGFDTGGPSQQSTNIAIVNNVFEDVRADYAFDVVRLVQFTEVAGLELRHNTFQLAGSFDILRTYGNPTTDFVYADNVIAYGTGVWSECGLDQAALDCLLPGAVFSGNLILGAPADTLPADNSFAPDVASVGFVDWAGGPADYHGYALAPGSTYEGTASDGTNPGIDPAAIDAARGGWF
jgi:hypothetical protein